MRTVRLTTAGALVRHLVAQRVEIDGEELPLFAGVFAIFGHGNVTALGEALHQAQDQLPTWRGQNEQGMALAAAAFAKARRRRQIMVATSSIGPGALNMVTAAGVAHSNRLPVLLLAGDTFAGRAPDPVLQQVEHFDVPSTTANDAFRPVSRYWDRIVRPAQLTSSLPHAIATMLDPADCGPAFLGLPQDVQAEAFDFPERFFAPVVHRIARPRPDERTLADAARVLSDAQRPLIVAGGGVHYSGAGDVLAAFAEQHGIPVVETVAGKSALAWNHPRWAGPIGVTGSTSANALAAEADVVLAVGTRLQDFTTGSWTVFGQVDMRLIALNVARFDATKHRALALVADARVGLEELSAMLGDRQAPVAWGERAASETAAWNAYVDKVTSADEEVEPPTYAQVIGALNRIADPADLVLTAAGGLPGELNKVWRARRAGTFDCEYGFSCMGYEIAGGWGAKLAAPERDVIVLVGDGSYLMLNSELYSSVLSGHQLIVVVCDNGGYAVIERLQVGTGGTSFNNMIAGVRGVRHDRVDFVAHAGSLGCRAEKVATLAELEAAFARAKAADRTAVIVIDTHPDRWTGGDAWWEVGIPEVSDRPAVNEARVAAAEHKANQRLGW